jgi:hypothetical protein
MKVKIGDQWYDGEKTPIMIVLENNEKDLISRMRPDNERFCVFPDGIPEEKILKFMKEK